MTLKSLKISLILAVIATGFWACDDVETTVCNTNDPVRDFTWLTDIKDSIQAQGWRGFIDSYNYRGEQVIFINPNPTGSEAENLCTARDCNGNILCSWGGPNGLLTCPSFWNEVTNRQELWSN